MAENKDKMNEKNAFEIVKDDYSKVRTHKERSEGLSYAGDINQLAGNVLGEFKSNYFSDNVKEDDLEGYVNGVSEYVQTRNIDGIVRAGGLAFQANVQYESERFKSNFEGENLEKLLDSSPEDVLLGVASQSYKKDYDGRNQETYLLHQEVRDIEILSNEKSNEEDKNGAIERITRRAVDYYEKKRVHYEDKRVDELVKQLDMVFGIPQRKYQKKPDILIKEFVESLKKNKNYLLEIADTKKLVGIYAGYFESLEQQKSKNEESD